MMTFGCFLNVTKSFNQKRAAPANQSLTGISQMIFLNHMMQGYLIDFVKILTKAVFISFLILYSFKIIIC